MIAFARSLCWFQIGHVLLSLNKLGKTEITTTTVNEVEGSSLGGLKIIPDYCLDKISVSKYDLLLIPGGDGIHLLVENEQISKMITVFIASLCGSAVFLRSEERRVGKECRCRWSRYR